MCLKQKRMQIELLYNNRFSHLRRTLNASQHKMLSWDQVLPQDLRHPPPFHPSSLPTLCHLMMTSIWVKILKKNVRRIVIFAPLIKIPHSLILMKPLWTGTDKKSTLTTPGVTSARPLEGQQYGMLGKMNILIPLLVRCKNDPNTFEREKSRVKKRKHPRFTWSREAPYIYVGKRILGKPRRGLIFLHL